MERASSGRVVRLADGGEKHAQVIVNFGRGGDCRSWIRAGAALLDRDGWGEAFDKIDVRFFHLIEELAGINRKAFYVAALAFGIERVEGKGRFSRAAQTRDDDQFPTRNFDVDIFQIVLARTTDLDNFRRHLDEKCRTFKSSTAARFLQRKAPIMSEANRTVSQEELVQLQKKFSETKHSINNALAVMMALSEMSQRRPDYAEKLATTVLSKAPQIVSSLQEFTQALNEQIGVKPSVAGESK